jgi:hypothetical protein
MGPQTSKSQEMKKLFAPEATKNRLAAIKFQPGFARPRAAPANRGKRL